MSTEERKRLLEQLNALKIFPDNNLVRQLRKQIKQKLVTVETKKSIDVVDFNLLRAKKLKKYHRYVRLVRDNFPNLKYSEIRKQFSKRKQGKEVSIPDVVWQNPSP